MKTLIEREIKVSRYVEKKKKAIRNENGLTKRQQSKADNTYLILDSYYIKKLSRKQICENLRLSLRTIEDYLDRIITIEDKIIFMLEKKISKRQIQKLLGMKRYALDKKISENSTLRNMQKP